MEKGNVFRANVSCEVIKHIDIHNVVLMGRVRCNGEPMENVFARYYSLNSQNTRVWLYSGSFCGSKALKLLSLSTLTKLL